MGKSVVVVGITAAISQLMSVGYLVFLARWVGPETYAIHVGIFNLCMISNFFVSWGLDTWLLKTTSEQPDSSAEILTKVILLKMMFGAIWAVALFVFAPLLRSEIFFRSLLLLAIISTLAETLTNSIYTVLLTTDRFRQSSAILLAGRLFRLLSLLVLAFGSIKDLDLIISIRTLIDVIVFFVASWVFGLQFSDWKFDLSSLKQTFTNAMPFHASDLINIIFRQVDVTLVTFLSRSLATISNYSLMISFFNVISTILLSLMNVLVPSLSRDRNHSADARRKTLKQTVFGFLVLGLVGWGVTVLFGQQAISLVLGDQYAMVADLISKTAIIVLISSLNVGLVAIIIANNRQKQRLASQVISLIFKMIGSIIIFTRLQVEGLRLIYILSEVVLSIGYFFVVTNVFHETTWSSKGGAMPGESLKIALLTFNQEGKGTYLRAYFLGKELVNLGHEVVLLAGNIEGRTIQQRNDEGLTIVTFPRLFQRWFLSGWGLDELISRLWWSTRKRFDLVHAFETRPTTLIPARLMQHNGAAFFVDWADWLGKGGSVEERPNPVKRGFLRIFETWYENRRFINSDGISAICTPLIDEAEKRGYLAEKLLLLPNGMRNPFLKSIPISDARAKTKLPLESTIIGYIGAGFKNDMDLMFSAYSLLKQQYEDVKLLHIGRSNYNISSDEGIILSGSVTDEDASYYLSSCDLFWFPLRKTKANLGRLPLKLSDYLTIGRPILSTDVGDLAVWIQRLDVGLVGNDDPESLGNMVIELINSTDRRGVLSRNAIVASNNPEFSWKKRAKELNNFYYTRMQNAGEGNYLGNDEL